MHTDAHWFCHSPSGYLVEKPFTNTLFIQYYVIGGWLYDMISFCPLLLSLNGRLLHFVVVSTMRPKKNKNCERLFVSIHFYHKICFRNSIKSNIFAFIFCTFLSCSAFWPFHSSTAIVLLNYIYTYIYVFLSFLFSFASLPFTLRSKNISQNVWALSRKVIVDLDLITSVRNAYMACRYWVLHVRDARQAFVKTIKLSRQCIFRTVREFISHRNCVHSAA